MIEVRELIIKATVAPGGSTASGSDTSVGTTNNGVTPSEELVTTCVERILDILKEKNER